MYGDEDEYLETLKREDSYHFSVPFEYIKKNRGGDDDEIGTAYMDVDVQWSDSDHGYRISHYCSSMCDIDPDEGNGSEDDFYDDQVEDIVKDKLSSEGVSTEAVCW